MFVHNHRLCADESEENSIEICEEIFVQEQYEDLFSGEITLKMGLWHRGVLKTFTIDRGELCDGIPAEFFKQGLTLLPCRENVEEVLDYVLDTDKVAQLLYRHRQLGFRTLDNKHIFLADKPIGDISPAKSDSRYYLPDVTAPKGTLKTWLNCVERDIIGHVNLELLLAISLSAPIAYLLREKKVLAEIPIWALIGESSSGKTTGLRVMASVFGSPEEGTGLIKDLNSTENAFFRSLSDSMGLLLIIDEATCKANWDFSKIVYNLSKGLDKNRCKSNGELRERLSFSGAIVISGENSLFGQSQANLGMYARMVELTLPWTEDAEHARQISQDFRRNYGTAVYPFLETLLTLESEYPDVLEKLFYNELQNLKSSAKTVSGVDERIFNMYAIVTVAAIIARQVLKIPLHIKKIRQLLLKQHGEVPITQSVAENFYNALMDYIARNGTHFLNKSNSNQNLSFPSNQWGEYSTRNMKSVIWITAETFREFAKSDMKLDNYKQHLSELHRMGLIEKFGCNHYTQNHNIGKVKMPCYCVINTTILKTKSKKSRNKSNRKIEHRHNLLMDDDD